MTNPNLERLHPYPFERLAALLEDVPAPAGLSAISLSIGEPRHAPPPFVLDALRSHLDGLGRYPPAAGLAALREAAAEWLTRRFRLRPGAVDPHSMVLPLAGTREGLFAFAQCAIDAGANPVVAMPNPFYQIYEGAALLAGAEPWYLDTPAADGFAPDVASVPDRIWRRCQLVYLCTPGNPTGAVLDLDFLVQMIELAQRHDFVLASDECYSEIYRDEAAPPPGLLEACAHAGHDDFRRCVVFHSLSKRSSLPGLRSGFVAGDPALIGAFRRYRSYHGCAMPLPAQIASAAAWRDEDHVVHNRARYRAKLRSAAATLRELIEFDEPAATFYLWLRTPIPAEQFARALQAHSNVTVLPGAYLARDAGHGNPGADRVRAALVGTEDECAEAITRLRAFIATL